MAPHDAPFVESAFERRRQIALTQRLFEAAAACHGESSLFMNGWLLRPLLDAEIETLRGPSCRCHCRDWSKLRLLLRNSATSRLDQSSALEVLVKDNAFAGTVVLGIDDSSSVDTNDKDLPTGVMGNALISNCVLEPGCCVYRNVSIHDTHVCSGASVVSCGNIASNHQAINYGTAQVTVGPESGGGRVLNVSAESTMVDVCQDLMKTKTPANNNNERPQEFVCNYNILCPHAVVRDCSTLENIYLASHAYIQASSCVKNAVLLPNSRIEASVATNVLLQWNAAITDHSHVSDTLLMEHAHAGPHSICASTVLGPDVHISAGEVHASLLGPNTNAHHQSLVISVLWPLGRGNVGYGANVGSNHTGRLPDQETCAGEGTFWGLSSVIKFPVNLLDSPYSIVAAGTTLVPQRVAMPFSLLVDGGGNTAPDGLCQLIPGWVLQNSPYTLTRSELKFATRRKAKRHGHYTGYKIIRPDIINACVAARDALENVVKKDVYKTDREVVGIGKNYLTERSRQAGIVAYSRCIQRYALRGLLERLQKVHLSGRNILSGLQDEFSFSEDSIVTHRTGEALQTVSWPELPWQQHEGSTWHHQRLILRQEFPTTTVNSAWVEELLCKLVELENDYAKRVHHSKKRDDARGAKTIPGYADAHVSAEVDAVIVHVQEEACKVEATVTSLVTELTMSDNAIETRSRL